MKPKNLNAPPVNAGSMADIAFLLLIFFLVTTTILQEKGLLLRLPPKPEEQSMAMIHERNLFKIQINSKNQYLIQGEVRNDLQGLKEEVQQFVLNYGKEPNLSVNPEKAVVSMKTRRGTVYKYFIAALDEVKAAYYEIYASKVGLTPEEYRSLDEGNPVQYELYLQGKEGIPMNISIAQPEGS